MTPGMDEARAALSRVFGFSAFRPDQETIIQSVLAGEDVLAVMPTGAGKSLCYQLPAIVSPGLTVVVSPLIALMRDQVAKLRAAGIAAGALNSGNDGGETLAVERAIEDRRLKLVYVAPERFALPGLVDLFKRGGASLLVIDEAHCISQWGHDFRPEYLALREIADDLGGLQTIAVTATANEPTRAEIVERLFARSPRVLVSSFDRPNLRLAMARKVDAFRQIAAFLERRRGESGIIYCASRHRTEKFADALSARGHRAIAYHAGLDPEARAAHQDEFLHATGVVMCATIAFGMGIDKPDVRFVCHADTPGGIEAWYQEIGRAGRDGLPADTLTLWSEEDIARRRRRVLDGAASRARKTSELARLDALLSICAGAGCRRRSLLAALGEASQPCGNCDNCDAASSLLGGIGAGRSLSAALRGTGKLVATRIGEILTGEASETLRRRAREWPRMLTTRVVGPDTEERRRVRRAVEGEPVSAAVMDDPISLRALTIDERRLLAALKARRLELARKTRRPPHAIMPDRALLDMVARRPGDVSQLTDIPTIGVDRVASYGELFLDVVRRHGNGAP